MQKSGRFKYRERLFSLLLLTYPVHHVVSRLCLVRLQGQVELLQGVGPAGELEVAGLLVERKPGHVNLKSGLLFT